MRLLLSILLCVSAWAVNPNRVLVLVNDNSVSETGTSGVGAGIYVGTHYATARNIPGGNILHLTCDTTETTTYANYQSQIETPVKAFLNASSGAMKHQILYIVSTYGMPWGITGSPNGTMALDSFLAAMYNPQTLTFGEPSYDSSPAGNNTPYNQSIVLYNGGSSFNLRFWTPPSTPPLRFEAFSDQRETAGGWKMFIAMRLDTTTAVKAAALVDKAIAAETTLYPASGTAYWDWQSTRNSTEWQLFFDSRVRDGGVLTNQLGVTTYLHRMTTSSGPAEDAPPVSPTTHSEASPPIGSGTNAVFVFVSAAGSCCGAPLQGQYSWIDGGMGSGLVSCSGGRLRTPLAADSPGTTNRWGCSWVARFLEDGATGAFGVTDEPGPSSGIGQGYNFHPHGIDIASFLYTGYNYGDSFYLSNTALRFVTYAIGDPLFQPRGIAARATTANRGVRFSGAGR